MREYRVYICDHKGEVIAPANIIVATDDADAVRQAAALVGGFDVEVWRNKRLIKRLPNKKSGDGRERVG